MAEALAIAVLVGTAREQRSSIHAARFIADFGAQLNGVETTLVDPRDFNFPGDGNDPEGIDPRYTQIAAQADAFFIVTPEYNHSFPGSLKRMLDTEIKNYIHKPVAFAGVSNRNWGGIRAIEALVPSVREMGLVATFTDVYFPNIDDIFATDGTMQSAFTDRYNRNVKKAYEELIWMANALREARNKGD